jgi:hypothetical protein
MRLNQGYDSAHSGGQQMIFTLPSVRIKEGEGGLIMRGEGEGRECYFCFASAAVLLFAVKCFLSKNAPNVAC